MLEMMQIELIRKPRFAGTLQSPLTDSNRRPPPYHGKPTADQAAPGRTNPHVRRLAQCCDILPAEAACWSVADDLLTVAQGQRTTGALARMSEASGSLASCMPWACHQLTIPSSPILDRVAQLKRGMTDIGLCGAVRGL